MKLSEKLLKRVAETSHLFAGVMRSPPFAMAFSLMWFIFVAAVLGLAALLRADAQTEGSTVFWVTVLSFLLTSFAFTRGLIHLSSIVSASAEKKMNQRSPPA
jgi:hypothetical protein